MKHGIRSRLHRQMEVAGHVVVARQHVDQPVAEVSGVRGDVPHPVEPRDTGHCVQQVGEVGTRFGTPATVEPMP